MCRYKEAASPFKGSTGLGYESSWGRKESKMFVKSKGEHQQTAGATTDYIIDTCLYMLHEYR